MRDLSILIPARNEMFLAKTIENILENIEGDTEVIAVCDGNWPEPPIKDHARVNLLYYPEPIGQRAATNEAARLSQAKFIMKCDAHCAFDKGFDVKLMADIEYDWTVVPRMYNLHGFDWKCKQCGNRTYQGPKLTKCEKCGGTEFEMIVVWEPRWNRKLDFMRFDNNMKYTSWRAYGKRPEAQGDIADQLTAIGACWMMHRERYWELGGCDENHGSWGQMGVEIACKSWLSGGRQVVNKKTWFAHLFRTRVGFGFPYPLSGSQVEKAREHSNALWKGNNWPRATRKLEWLLEKFKPIPDWHDMTGKPTKALVYYTDNHAPAYILETCQKQLNRCMETWKFPIISVSQKPIDFGQNIVMDLERSVLSLYKQVLRGLEESTAEVIFLIEHDILYHPSHFDFTPERKDVFYYNRNRWPVCADTGKAVFYHSNCPSMLCAHRELLIKHYQQVVEIVERDGWKSKYGFSPPRGLPKELRIGKYKTYMAEYPCIDIRHSKTLTRKRMDKSEFRSERSCRGWTEAEEVPGWGRTKDRFNEFLTEVNNESIP